eukprot:TRINITY_DN23356_c0_g1_i1.p3 TRINITY_DN23356_c0_g1~~TRINITY_DN23356_c0_g1_i1.p3  ORF type:complete len:273 (-),score=12.52 TRINITY_DN23356_c0_g1_i1:501-1319(-)
MHFERVTLTAVLLGVAALHALGQEETKATCERAPVSLSSEQRVASSAEAVGEVAAQQRRLLSVVEASPRVQARGGLPKHSRNEAQRADSVAPGGFDGIQKGLSLQPRPIVYSSFPRHLCFHPARLGALTEAMCCSSGGGVHDCFDSFWTRSRCCPLQAASTPRRRLSLHVQRKCSGHCLAALRIPTLLEVVIWSRRMASPPAVQLFCLKVFGSGRLVARTVRLPVSFGAFPVCQPPREYWTFSSLAGLPHISWHIPLPQIHGVKTGILQAMI